MKKIEAIIKPFKLDDVRSFEKREASPQSSPGSEGP
jgi:nitrogen regulatory protein PII